MADLKTNYVDDVLDSNKNQFRKYQMIYNDDGTVSFVDVTTYTQNGDSFGAKDINDTNAAVNKLNSNLDNLVNFSWDLKPCGKWVNGKTIYKKMMAVHPTTVEFAVAHNLDSNKYNIIIPKLIYVNIPNQYRFFGVCNELNANDVGLECNAIYLNLTNAVVGWDYYIEIYAIEA